MKAAAGKVDLEPPIGIWLTGYGGRTSGSTGRHDPLTARAVVVSDGEKTVAIVSCEVVGWDVDDDLRMRWSIEHVCGIPASHVLINCTHTHSGPASMPLRGQMGILDQRWLAEAQRKVVDLVALLSDRLQPAVMAQGRVEVPGLGFNRQDGGGPQDETLKVLRFEAPDGRAIATVGSYCMHAVVMGSGNLALSGDFPGAFARAFDSKDGVGIYLQGTCGDIDPAINRDRGWGTGTFDDTEGIGRRLALAAEQALTGAARVADAPVRVASTVVPIPLSEPRADLYELLAKMHTDFDAQTEESARSYRRGELEWAHDLEKAVATKTVPTELRAAVTALAVGDMRVVGLPFETYTQIGLDVQEAFEPAMTMVLGYSNGLFGYCATDEARRKGGYGPDASHRWFPRLLTPLADGADRALVAAAVDVGRHVSSCDRE